MLQITLVMMNKKENTQKVIHVSQLYLWLKHSISAKDLKRDARWNTGRGKSKRPKLSGNEVIQKPYVMKCPTPGCNYSFTNIQSYKDHVLTHLEVKVKSEEPEQILS